MVKVSSIIKRGGGWFQIWKIFLQNLLLCLPNTVLLAFYFPHRIRWRWNSAFTSTSRYRVKLHHSSTETLHELLQGQKHLQVQQLNMLLSPAERGAEWGHLSVKTSNCVSLVSRRWRYICPLEYGVRSLEMATALGINDPHLISKQSNTSYNALRWSAQSLLLSANLSVALQILKPTCLRARPFVTIFHCHGRKKNEDSQGYNPYHLPS